MGLHVALITTEFPPHIDGGAGVYAGHLVEALRELGVHVEVFSPLGVSQINGDKASPVTPARQRGIIPFWRSLPRAYLGRTRRRPFDVVHSNGIAGLPVHLLARSTPRVVTVHHVTQALRRPGILGLRQALAEWRGEAGITPTIERWAIALSDLIVSVSPATTRAIENTYPGTAGRTRTVLPGLPELPRTNDRAAEEFRHRFAPSGTRLLLSVGRLEYRKGYDVLLKAFSGLNADVHLLIIGEGKTGPYESLARELGCETRVTFVPHVSADDLAAAYRACDVFVMPSRLEGMGYAALEAMSSARPVVVTRTGGALDGIIDNGCGAVVEIGDAAGLRRGIVRLLADRDNATSVGLRNRARVATLSWRTAAEATLDAYQTAIAAKDQR